MADFGFQTELTKAIQSLTDFASVEIAYTRKSVGYPAIMHAVPGKSDYEVQDQFGFKVEGVCVDFIMVCDFEPALGDTIRVGETVYELLDFGGNGCWRWCDGYRIAKRLHTREVS